jgi:hypothetical protein
MGWLPSTLLFLYNPIFFASHLLPASCWFLAWLNSLTLKVEATGSSKMSDDFHWTTQCYIPEDKTLQGIYFFYTVELQIMFLGLRVSLI